MFWNLIQTSFLFINLFNVPRLIKNRNNGTTINENNVTSCQKKNHENGRAQWSTAAVVSDNSCGEEFEFHVEKCARIIVRTSGPSLLISRGKRQLPVCEICCGLRQTKKDTRNDCLRADAADTGDAVITLHTILRSIYRRMTTHNSIALTDVLTDLIITCEIQWFPRTVL